MNKIFQYYNAIIPQKAHWQSVCSEPLPTCFWTNTLKISSDELRTSLENDGVDLKTVTWNPNAFISSTSALGKRWEYSAGLMQIQEEVSMLPVHFLDPQPGERVLDLCAAPGNKTAQIAKRLNNSGSVIANDKNFQRMRAFGQISKRLGLINVSTSIYDGRNYPDLENYFDRVLVDAPCSGEGTFRKGRIRDIELNPKNSLRLQRIQISLLRKAIRLCRPGGRIVYSTCTFSPEENEAVIDTILRTQDDVTLKPIRLENFQLTPGVTEWQSSNYDAAVKNTARVWPHLNNTGGFFVAVLEKQSGVLQQLEHLRKPTSKAIEEYIKEQITRFGFPESLFKDYQYSDDNYRGIYLTNAENCLPEAVKLDASGLFFIKTRIQYPKLSTAATMLFGKHATQNVVVLSETQRDQYLQNQDFTLTEQQTAGCTDTGYVIVQYAGHTLGAGLYFEPREERGPMLRSLFPKYLK